MSIPYYELNPPGCMYFRLLMFCRMNMIEKTTTTTQYNTAHNKPKIKMRYIYQKCHRTENLILNCIVRLFMFAASFHCFENYTIHILTDYKMVIVYLMIKLYKICPQHRQNQWSCFHLAICQQFYLYKYIWVHENWNACTKLYTTENVSLRKSTSKNVISLPSWCVKSHHCREMLYFG